MHQGHGARMTGATNAVHANAAASPPALPYPVLENKQTSTAVAVAAVSVAVAVAVAVEAAATAAG